MQILARERSSSPQDLAFNFAIGILDGSFFGFALGFGSFAAVIPLFVRGLTDSALLIGLIPAIHNVGWQLPQLFTAGWVSRSTRYKPLVLWNTIHERLPFLGLALVAWLLPQLGTNLALILIFALLVWQGMGGGMAANPWQNMIVKIIPRDLHGTFFGLQAAASNALGGISAILSGLILEKWVGPANFALCFLLTALSLGLSFLFLVQTREPESPSRPPAPSTKLWKEAHRVLSSDRNFALFLGVRTLSQFASMAFAFFLIYAVAEFKMSAALAGVMTGVLLISQVAAGSLMGRLGDRWSHRGVMILGALAAALSAILALEARAVQWFYLVFLLEAVAVVAIWVVPMALTVRFARRDEDRPLYFGLSNTFTAPATILAPILGGWIADTAGFHLTFALSAGFAVAMALVLALWIREPEAHTVSI